MLIFSPNVAETIDKRCTAPADPRRPARLGQGDCAAPTTTARGGRRPIPGALTTKPRAQGATAVQRATARTADAAAVFMTRWRRYTRLQAAAAAGTGVAGTAGGGVATAVAVAVTSAVAVAAAVAAAAPPVLPVERGLYERSALTEKALALQVHAPPS